MTSFWKSRYKEAQPTNSSTTLPIKTNWSWLNPTASLSELNMDLVPIAKHEHTITRILQLTSKRFLITTADGSMSVWDLTTGELLASLLGGHNQRITAVTSIRQSCEKTLDRLASASLDKYLVIWDLNKGIPLIRSNEESNVIRCLCYIPEIDLIVSGGSTLCLWTCESILLDRVSDMFENEDIRYLLIISGNRIVCAYDKFLTVYCAELITETDNVVEDSVSYQFENISTPESDENLKSNEIANKITVQHSTYQLVHVKKLPYHMEVVHVLQEVGDSAFLSASLDGCITLWSTRYLAPTKLFNQNRANAEDFHRFALSVESVTVVDQLLIAGVGNGFAVFDTNTNFAIADIREAHEAKVSTVVYVWWLDLLVTGGMDGRIRFWGYIEDKLSTTSIKSNRKKGSDNPNLNVQGIQTNQINKEKSLLPEKTFLRVPVSELTSLSPVNIRKDISFKNRYKMVCFHELLGHAAEVTQIINCEKLGLLSCGRESFVFFWRNRSYFEETILKQLSLLYPF